MLDRMLKKHLTHSVHIITSDWPAHHVQLTAAALKRGHLTVVTKPFLASRKYLLSLITVHAYAC